MGETILTCQRCGRPARHLWLCQECRDEGEDHVRIATTVTSCCRALAHLILCCMYVVLSNGKDRSAMAKALSYEDMIDDLDKAMKELV